MNEKAQVAMTCQKVLEACLFHNIYFTCNRNWPEITRELLPGQSSSDRYDIVDRMFELKNKILLTLLKKVNFFAQCNATFSTLNGKR